MPFGPLVWVLRVPGTGSFPRCQGAAVARGPGRVDAAPRGRRDVNDVQNATAGSISTFSTSLRGGISGSGAARGSGQRSREGEAPAEPSRAGLCAPARLIAQRVYAW